MLSFFKKNLSFYARGTTVWGSNVILLIANIAVFVSFPSHIFGSFRNKTAYIS